MFQSICLIILGISQSMIQAKFTFVNKCDYTVWPGISSKAGTAPLQPTGFALQKGESKELAAPSSWAGRFWGRTHCSQDPDGKFTCGTGDCGSGTLECAGAGATPPATLAEFSLGGGDGRMYSFAVSLMDGYNLPMLVSPTPSGGSCTCTGCTVDLNQRCPLALRVVNPDGKVLACKSACGAFGREDYCCSGVYGTRDACKPSSYSQQFKTACPRAYTYAYDDNTGTFSCSGADYQITFCPTPISSKESKEEPATPPFNTGDAPPWRFHYIYMVIGGMVGVVLTYYGVWFSIRIWIRIRIQIQPS